MESGKVVKISPSDAIGAGEDMSWLKEGALSIVVVGASGDLAKKKTFPSLCNLFDDNLLPASTKIWGYARSSMTDDDLRDRLRPYLKESGSHSDEVVELFLENVHYKSGNGYGDVDAFDDLRKLMQASEKENAGKKEYNRLFYLAIPPNVFGDTAIAIKKTCMQEPSKGFSRIVVEKPFGHDLTSFEELNKTLAEHFQEEQIYRIDRKSWLLV
jgi:glucose-6-phosphate 1-dehydrogenase